MSDIFSGATTTEGIPSNGSEKLTRIFHDCVQSHPEYVPGQSAAPFGVTLLAPSTRVVLLPVHGFPAAIQVFCS